MELERWEKFLTIFSHLICLRTLTFWLIKEILNIKEVKLWELIKEVTFQIPTFSLYNFKT